MALPNPSLNATFASFSIFLKRIDELMTFITEPVGLLATAVLASPAEHLEVLSLLLGYHHQH